MKAQKWVKRYSSTFSLTSALDGVGGQRHALDTSFLGTRPGTLCTGGWVRSRPVWTGAVNLTPPGFNPWTVQPVA